MVAHTSCKTPTAVADFIIGLYMEQAARLEALYNRCRIALNGMIAEEEGKLARFSDRLKNSCRMLIADKENKLNFVEFKIKAMDPQQLLERGFVMVADENGRRMVSVEDIPPEGKMKLFMKDGVVELDFVVRKIFEK